MCYSEKHKGITNYWLDHMDSVSVKEEPASERAQAYGQEVAQYTSQVFKMFGGELKNVPLEFDDDLTGPVFDKFGEGKPMLAIKENTYAATVHVQLSQTFFGWLAQFGNMMRIISPVNVVKRYMDHILSSAETID